MSDGNFRHWSSAVQNSVKFNRIASYPRKLKAVLGDPRARWGTFYGDLNALASRYGTLGNLTGSEFRVFSQNGEDGVIAELVRRLGNSITSTFVEFGSGPGRSGNCLALADLLAWEGLFIEPASHDFDQLANKYRFSLRVKTSNEFVYPWNIDSLIEKAGLARVGVLSIDIDGNDYYVWEQMQTPADIVVIEYNGALPLEQFLVQPFSNAPWDGTEFFGSSLEALVHVGRSKGYFLVHTELTGTNAFFVADAHRDAFNDLVEVPKRSVNYELLGFRHGADSKTRNYLPDSKAALESMPRELP
jgi:hypothetical protein